MDLTRIGNYWADWFDQARRRGFGKIIAITVSAAALGAFAGYQYAIFDNTSGRNEAASKALLAQGEINDLKSQLNNTKGDLETANKEITALSRSADDLRRRRDEALSAYNTYLNAYQQLKTVYDESLKQAEQARLKDANAFQSELAAIVTVPSDKSVSLFSGRYIFAAAYPEKMKSNTCIFTLLKTTVGNLQPDTAPQVIAQAELKLGETRVVTIERRPVVVLFNGQDFDRAKSELLCKFSLYEKQL